MTSHILYHGSGFRIGEYRCPSTSMDWRTENWIGARPHVVFAGPAVGITQSGRDPLIATPNEVVLYNAGTFYRRQLVSPEGDHSVFIELEPVLADEIGSFTSTWAPVPAAHYAFFRLANRLGSAPDALVVDEFVVGLLARLDDRPPPVGDRAATVEQVKALLASRLVERLTLSAIASEVNYSPYHLARMFRSVTGTSICSYRTELRVRQAIERVRDPSVPLATIAADLGFASHAHFTTTFRRVLGVRPVDVRRTGQLPPAPSTP